MSDGILNILIIEDDIALQDVYGMILRSQGYRVEAAYDGLEGLKKLNTFEPNIILLDYFMPRMDGKNFLENYDGSLHPNTKIVLATNVSDQSVINELLALGADRSVLKADLSPSGLLELIEETT